MDLIPGQIISIYSFRLNPQYLSKFEEENDTSRKLEKIKVSVVLRGNLQNIELPKIHLKGGENAVSDGKDNVNQTPW